MQSPHAPLPQLMFQGGPLVTAPRVVTITFAGDPYATALEAFDDAIVSSDWWDSVTSGLCNDQGACIGRGSSGGHVELTAAAAPSYADTTDGSSSTLQTFLADQITQGVLPAPDSNTLYVLFVPPTTQVTVSAQGQQTNTSCVQFEGYHNEIVINGVPVPFAVVPECAPGASSNLTQMQSLTFAAGHEIIEAASDPVQTPKTLGFYLNTSDTTVLAWNQLSGGEAADLCVDVSGLHQDQTTAAGYTVPRVWSNANAMSGVDPCTPTPTGDVYFNVAPSGTNAYIVLAVGQSATFEAVAFSSAATSAWTLGGVDRATLAHEVKSPLLSFTFNGQKTATVNNGDKVVVVVTLDADPSAFGGAEGLLLSITGTTSAPTAAHPWPILVLTPDEAQFGL